MRILKVISISLATFVTLLTCKYAIALPMSGTVNLSPTHDFCGRYSNDWVINCNHDENSAIVDEAWQ